MYPIHHLLLKSTNIDCDDDGIPNEKGWFWDTKGYAKDLVIDDEGEYVIVADGPGGLSIFRLTDEDADLDDATINPSEGVDDCFINAASGGPNGTTNTIFYYILLLTGLSILIEILFNKIKHSNS